MHENLNFYWDFRTIQNVRDFAQLSFGHVLFFGRGLFDDWCAYCATVRPDGVFAASMPSDMYYFEILDQLAAVHGPMPLFDDCKHIFERCGNQIDPRIVKRIVKMSIGYAQNQPWAYNAFMHVYYGMVAENNRKFYDDHGNMLYETRLGASIKMNGIYSLLIDRRGVQVSAKECCGANWRLLADECERRHIFWDDERNPML